MLCEDVSVCPMNTLITHCMPALSITRLLLVLRKPLLVLPLCLLSIAAAELSAAAHAAPGIVSPSEDAVLDSATETFTWSADGSNVDAWVLNIGTWPGGLDIASSGRLENQTSLTVSGLPRDGSTVHARLFVWTEGRWLVIDSSYATSVAGTDTDADAGDSDASADAGTDASPETEPQTDAGSGAGADTDSIPDMDSAAEPDDGSEAVAPDTGSTGLVTGKDATPPSSAWARPQIGVAYDDPIYGTGTRRMTDAGSTRFDRNTYSRRQAENADGTRFMTYHGTARYRVYDRSSLQLIRELDIHPDSEPQWHPSNADAIRHVAGPDATSGDLKLYETQVSSGKTTVIADLTDRLRAVFPAATHMKDKAEGAPSVDGSRYAWIVHDATGQPIGLVSYDLAADRILGTRPVRSDVGRLDWVSTSPTGKHVVAGYVNATIVHASDLDDERRINDKADHSDIALDADGRDAYVYIDFSAGIDGGWLVSVDLATLQRTRLIDFYDQANTSVHVSGKGYDKPGWVVVSTYNCKVDGAWSCNKVLAVEMQSDPAIVNLAHTYNCGESYWTETHAVVNRSFTRVYYNSDASRCTTEAEVYELSLPPLP